MARGIKTGGRKKGTPNKVNAARQALVAAGGETPLDYLLKVMRDENGKLYERLEAAKAAAPFVHPKLSAVEMTGKDGLPISPPVVQVVFTPPDAQS